MITIKTRFVLISLLVSMAVYFVVTWPLGAEFHAGIPSSNRPEVGGARYMIPGDHLQFLYQLWMLADSFTGGTPLFYHVYEFNQGNDQALYNPGSYYFPFGLLYSAGYALGGRVVAWNIMLYVTVWLIYLSTWLLLMRFSRSILTAAVAALPSILLPYFYVSLLGGSPTGMGMLWVPLIFLGVDVAIRDRKLWGGILAGILLFICSWVDLHVFFFVFLATPVWALMCVAFQVGTRSLSPLGMGQTTDIAARSAPPTLKSRGWPLLPIFIGMVGAYLQTSMIKSSLDHTLQSQGRTMNESLGYALKWQGWFDMTLDNQFNIIYIGVAVALILAVGLVLLVQDVWRNKPQAKIQLALWLMVLGVLAGIAVLALGPNTPFDHGHRLWQLLRKVIPPYKMIRQPAKIYCILAPFLGIALAVVIDRLRRISPRQAWSVGLAAVIGVGLLVDYGRRLDPTICLLDYEQGGYRAVAEDATKTGRENRAMAIPLWPGDSHWNSITEYYATLYRTKMLNGYSPSVSRQYFADVFQRFEAINMGLVTDDILDGLLAMKVGYLILHEDAFPQKVSPFSVSQTLRELQCHPRLQFLAHDKTVWAFKILESPQSPLKNIRLTEDGSPYHEKVSCFGRANRPGEPDIEGTPLLACWQWDACDVAGGTAVVVNEGSNVFMRLPSPGGHVKLDSRTLYPLEGLRYVASVRGNGVLAGSCGSGLAGDAFSVAVVSTGAWTWVELPVPALPSGNQTWLAPVFTNVAGSLDISMITILGGSWKWLAPGESLTLPAKACFYSAYSDPASDTVYLDNDRVQAGVALYAPIVPVLPGTYQVALEFQTKSKPGTVMGTWSVMRSDGKERVSKPVVAGTVAILDYSLSSPRPLRLECDYNRTAGMTIQAVKLTRKE